MNTQQTIVVHNFERVISSDRIFLTFDLSEVNEIANHLNKENFWFNGKGIESPSLSIEFKEMDFTPNYIAMINDNRVIWSIEAAPPQRLFRPSFRNMP